ncbi:hypothetical protein N5J77_08475 [Sphingobium yanoikuyae]|uniref:Uncharacterized protein n=1 Tax=Sphingobium yanoikuyae TaxID=13690 RepID=A0AA42WSS9_SPHYA|nr:hypothetical protein [Sphingobium yanoikuyae]MDH2131154.1 hypothetical protein [Sphingobium yanoikuyae]MDH2152953.1 hypothetical protein [Sphingobium yanoikuyae]MDH2166358.1 hypothetical protein [Sphingobium yanoikuyae]
MVMRPSWVLIAPLQDGPVIKRDEAPVRGDGGFEFGRLIEGVTPGTVGTVDVPGVTWRVAGDQYLNPSFSVSDPDYWISFMTFCWLWLA